ncbi:MAG: hypothetical protein RDV00_04175 [Clostridia bacterium]|nr:hypothetical protein [Clostridia bacterium]MDQ7791307.1 hypothetical protein [Clostridia bacterium]
MLLLVSIAMVAVAVGLLYKGHINNSKLMLLMALVLTLGGMALLYHIAGGNL